ncbi:MAG: radical SAM protein [Candidatus Pacebacteria bacterium]|nr:radical SAM protein [Candidatus Paceibacterota bacterium]
MQEKCLFVYVGQPDMSFALAGKRDYDIKREPQIGFAYLVSVLRQQGVDSEILDFTITPYTKESLNSHIAEVSPLFVGFYGSAAMKDHMFEFLRATREKFPKLKIFAGGPDMFDCESYLNAGVDVFCLNEGEKTIVEMIEYCRGKINLPQIKGIAYKERGEIKYTPERELVKNLDELPMPAWDKFDLNNFYDYHVFDMRTPYTSIMASRGCPFKCSYCVSHKIWGGVYRSRSVESVLEEIDYLVKEKGVKYLMFQDDIWSWLNDDWAREFCQKLIERNYDLKWRCILHPFSFLKSRKEILPLMKKAGCSSITIGLQSASKEILKNVNRSPEQPQALADLVKELKKSGILNSVEFIFGLPGDTEETMEETIKFALKIKPTFCGFYVLTVLIGSDIWLAQKEGKFQPMPEELVQRKCKEAAKRFYTNPRVVFNTFEAILRTNPRWFLKVFGHGKYLLEIAGILGKKTVADIPLRTAKRV